MNIVPEGYNRSAATNCLSPRPVNLDRLSYTYSVLPALTFKEKFKQILATEVENVIGVPVLDVGKRFESWDSFAFLVTATDKKKYVGKIFRFPHWPPEGKLTEVTRILNQYHISHENSVYITHNHPIFEFGWQLTEFISGGNAKEALENKLTNKETYLKKLGAKLRQVHAIELGFFGSLQNPEHQHMTFQGLAREELSDQNFGVLPDQYKYYENVISDTIKEVQRLLKYLNFSATLVHDDVGTRNVLWNNGALTLIDWVDSVAGPAVRDFATVTFREEAPVLMLLEEGYGQEINREELRLHQLMRFIRLGHFYYSEDKDTQEFEVMMDRAKALLNRDTPFGAE